LNNKQTYGKIHLHIHALSAFSSRPILLAKKDLPNLGKPRALTAKKCYKTLSKQLSTRALTTPTLFVFVNKIYLRLLLLFTNVFCFFADNIKQFKPIIQRLALWLDLGQASTLPKSTCLKVLIITKQKKDVLGDNKSDLKVFKQMLSKKTTINVSEQFLNI
jgi:hypothetical protein